MKVLRRTQFGNPILRLVAQPLSAEALCSRSVQQLINNMYHTLETKRYGVGLAAPQVGHSLALAIINIQPTPHRPDVEPFRQTIANPKIVKTYGRRASRWEGCISLGGRRDSVFAQVPRYRRIRLRYQDGSGKRQEQDFSGFAAHVIQHEVDHLNGILFVDKVVDSHSFVSLSEYKRRYRPAGDPYK